MWGSQNLHIGIKLIQGRLKKAFVSYDGSGNGNYDEDLFQMWKKLEKQRLVKNELKHPFDGSIKHQKITFFPFGISKSYQLLILLCCLL